MRSVGRITVLVALVAFAGTGAGAPPRATRAVVAADYRLVFLDGDERAPVHQGVSDDATIEIGTITAGRCHALACLRTVVQRRFRLRIDGSSTARFVRVQAFLQSEVPGYRVRIDGRILTSAPQLVDPASPLRIGVAHTLEIEVLASEPDGLLAQTIEWVVEDAR